jgi:hypothetical protein
MARAEDRASPGSRGRTGSRLTEASPAPLPVAPDRQSGAHVPEQVALAITQRAAGEGNGAILETLALALSVFTPRDARPPSPVPHLTSATSDLMPCPTGEAS